MDYKFDTKKVTKELLEWLKNWFLENGKDCMLYLVYLVEKIQQ